MKILTIFIFLLSFTLQLTAQPIEEMEYILRFGFLKGGKANLVAERERLNKKQTIHYHVRGRTTGLVDHIYEVNDVFDCWVDPATYLPLKSVRSVKEQKYRFYDEVTYDQVNDSIFSLKAGRKKVPDNVNDLISIFFYIRQNQYFDALLAGEVVKLPVYHGGQLFMIQLAYMGIETIDTKIGKKQCYVVSPKVPEGKLLKDSDGLKIYITKDANRLPIYAEFELIVGALKCELETYKINGISQMVDQ
jgi:hypothetical protein